MSLKQNDTYNEQKFELDREFEMKQTAQDIREAQLESGISTDLKENICKEFEITTDRYDRLQEATKIALRVLYSNTKGE